MKKRKLLYGILVVVIIGGILFYINREFNSVKTQTEPGAKNEECSIRSETIKKSLGKKLKAYFPCEWERNYENIPPGYLCLFAKKEGDTEYSFSMTIEKLNFKITDEISKRLSRKAT
ncbi:MAG TPA: hypothetical protein VGO58_04450 [Chitinophagaceae bacterium]|jgi:hypothetical protein|nr:hypothetical protein [Chitinophagaceae bacterium]